MAPCEQLSIVGITCALGGCGIVSICRLLWQPLKSAERWHKDRVEGSKEVEYIALPIYSYLRRYLVGLTVVGMAVVLISVAGTVLGTVNNCKDPMMVIDWIMPLLLALFFTHAATISIYENGRRRQESAFRERMPKKTTEFVKTFRNRLWESGLLLLVVIVIVFLAARCTSK